MRCAKCREEMKFVERITRDKELITKYYCEKDETECSILYKFKTSLKVINNE